MRQRSSSSRPPASRRSSWTTRSSSTRWCSSSCGDARRARGTSRAATRDRSRSAIPHSSAWGRTPPRSAACAGTSRRGTASPSAPPSRPRPARSSAFSRTACAEGIPVPFRAGFWTLGIADKRIWVWIVLVLALVVYLLQLYLERSRRGFQLAAVREDEDAALSLGVRARRLKVAAIAASAAFTAVCGALWAQYVGFVDPLYVFSVDLSVRFALAAIIGGLGTALGPFLGSVLVTTVETWLRAEFGGLGSHLVGLYLILYGTALILMVRYAPQGLMGFFRKS